MNQEFAVALYGAGFSLVGWLVIAIIQLKLAVQALTLAMKPLLEDIPAIKKDNNMLHEKFRKLESRKTLGGENGKD